MGLTAWGIFGLCQRALMHSRRIGTLIAMCAAIFAAVVVYMVAAILLKAVTKEDMKLIPGGEKIARILHMR
jgi:stage V sporulation protein B